MSILLRANTIFKIPTQFFLQIFKGHAEFHMKIKGNKQKRIAKAMMDNKRTLIMSPSLISNCTAKLN